MKNNLFFALGFAFFLLSCKNHSTSSTIASSSFKKISNKKTLKLDTLFTDYYEEGSFNGNVLIAENGNIIFEKSFGLANEENQTKLNPETVFELASLSKQFTAMGIVQLEKDGKLSYNDNISKYVPELESYKGIKIKNLLNHTGGLPDYMKLTDSLWNKSQIASNDDILKLFEKAQPKALFQPNERWDYSNTGYLVLATIIERVSKQSFEEFLKEKIFDPLKMDNTSIYRRRYSPEKIENYADGYIYSDSLDSKILPDELGRNYYVVYLDGIVGDGMVNSNVRDLLKWDRALYNNEIINNEDRQLIFSSQKTKKNTDTDYGFGWMIDSTKTYGKIASHSGGWAGYVNYIERDIDNDKTIIILQNNLTPKTEIPIKNTRRILYNLPVERPIKLTSDILKSYSGRYLNEDQKEKEIVFENNKLYIPMSQDYKMELVPVSKTKFIVEGFSPEVTYTFSFNEDGSVEKYRVQQESSGLDREAQKIR